MFMIINVCLGCDIISFKIIFNYKLQDSTVCTINFLSTVFKVVTIGILPVMVGYITISPVTL